jgi:hypothetical protein
MCEGCSHSLANQLSMQKSMILISICLTINADTHGNTWITKEKISGQQSLYIIQSEETQNREKNCEYQGPLKYNLTQLLD